MKRRGSVRTLATPNPGTRMLAAWFTLRGHLLPSPQVHSKGGGSPGPVTAQQRRSLALAAQEAADAAAEELDEVGACSFYF